MRISYLTAGAAGMYCGSCMHDNSLARALIGRGLDCLLVPTYTPIRTDEKNISGDEVFFGGINIFLEQSLPFWGKLPRVLTRWLDSPTLLKIATRKTGGTSPKLLGALTVSMLQGKQGRQKIEVDRLCKWLETHARPDAIILSNLLIGGCIPTLKQRLGVPIVVTLQGDDIFLDYLPKSERDKSITLMRDIAREVDAFIVNSAFYGNKMAEILGLSRDQWHVIPLGIDLQPFANHKHSTEQNDPPKIGYLARIDPAKGLHNLVDAFIELNRISPKGSPASKAELHVAGWLGDHQRAYADEQWKVLDEAGLSDRYTYHGSPDQQGKVDFLRSLDVFSVPTDYEEPKGLFVLEAMASGLAIVQPNHGAFPDVIEHERTGVLYTPGSTEELANCWKSLLDDEVHRREIATSARAHVVSETTIDRMAGRVHDLIRECLES